MIGALIRLGNWRNFRSFARLRRETYMCDGILDFSFCDRASFILNNIVYSLYHLSVHCHVQYSCRHRANMAFHIFFCPRPSYLARDASIFPLEQEYFLSSSHLADRKGRAVSWRQLRNPKKKASKTQSQRALLSTKPHSSTEIVSSGSFAVFSDSRIE